MMDGDEKNNRALDDKGMEEYDYGFDQFLDEEEIDINTFVLPPLPKCSICDAPFPFKAKSSVFKTCCGNSICGACDELTVYGEVKRRLEDEPHTCINITSLQKCPFCRKKPPGAVAALEKLVERGNGKAMAHLAHRFLHGNGVPGDQKKAIKLYHMAAEAGHANTCCFLGKSYSEGESFDNIVIQKDRGKAIRLFTKGARLGYPECLKNLGVMLFKDGQGDSAAQCFLKAASGGLQNALGAVKEFFMAKLITKEDYASALRSFQAVHDQINTEERKRFNKRQAAHRTLHDFDSMTKESQVEVLNEVLGPVFWGNTIA